jgi:alpha-N-arabinofuranosidase
MPMREPAGMSRQIEQTQEVVIHADRVIRRGLDRFFGIDLNYIRDQDENRPGARPLDAALKDMGVRWLRFPGGEKSNYHLWSVPPYSKPDPHSLGWYGTVKGTRMDFDQYMKHVRAARAYPYVVVGYESEAHTGRTKAQWMADAVAWVRYAKSRNYHVQHWEIGNENWNHHAAPEAIALVVKQFSAAMKAADPSIKVGASGNSDAWWSKFLPIAAPSLDFLTVSQYTGWDWKTYDHFLGKPDLIETAEGAVRAIEKYAPAADRSRLRVIVAETNTKDYANGGWPDDNDLGHALVTFATLGRLAMQPRIQAAMVWTTRWMNDDEAPSSPFYALGSSNQLMPTGRAIALWGQNAESAMIETEGDDTFAASSDDARRISVWILNRETAPRTVHIVVDGGKAYLRALCRQFGGTAAADRRPSWNSRPGVEIKRNSWMQEVPPLSVTVFTLESR